MSPGHGTAVMVIEEASSFQTELATGLASVLEPLGIPLQIHLCGRAGARPPASLVRALRDPDVRSAVVTPISRPDTDARIAELLANRPDLRRVYLCAPGPGAAVRADNRHGMQLVGRHLVADCRARRVLVVRGLAHHLDAQEREEALRAELAQLGVPVPESLIVDGEFHRETAHRVVLEALERDPGIDAVAALNDRSALGAMDAAAMLGRRIPDDLVVTGFDDEGFAAFSRPPLTTVSPDLHRQGALAGELLLRMAAGEEVGEIRVPTRLTVRGTTRRSTGGPGGGPDRADLLWDHVAAMDTVLSMSREFLSCATIEEIVARLSSNLRLLGVTRAFLALRSQIPGPAYGVLAMSYEMGQRQVVASGEPFDLARLLPDDLQDHLSRGTLVVQPLTIGDTEIGYLLLDGVLRRGSYAGEVLRMDLSRTIESIRRTARLAERSRQLETRTRQLECEVASRREAQRALTYQAHHDPLTGLANRAAFVAGVEPAVGRAERSGAIVLIDLDRFRDVNDILGHAVGDALLRAVATRLSELIGDRGTLFRLGGDEFVVAAPDVTAADAMSLAYDVVALLRQQFRLDGLTLEIDGSVGVACAPRHATCSADLLRMADLAMYAAKSEHVGAALYDPDQHDETPRRLAVFGELRRALADDELVVHYQPVVDIPTGTVSGVEALVRWAHPARGLVPPAEFLDVAEQTGLIHPLTTYVLDRALAECRSWLDQGLTLVVAVNVSARRLSDAGLPHEISRLLAQHDVPASLLVLEVTETAAMADPDRALAVLLRLRQLGVRLSVDDFGTGHASLAYLSRLPVTALKIDRSFVLTMESDPANLTIVRSTLDLARNLGLQVIAEGVETEIAYQRLASFGCDQAQGYWLSRPVPADRIRTLVPEMRGRLAGRVAASARPSPPPNNSPGPQVTVPRPGTYRRSR